MEKKFKSLIIKMKNITIGNENTVKSKRPKKYNFIFIKKVIDIHFRHYGRITILTELLVVTTTGAFKFHQYTGKEIPRNQNLKIQVERGGTPCKFGFRIS